jgi:hypothetical protein
MAKSFYKLMSFWLAMPELTVAHVWLLNVNCFSVFLFLTQRRKGAKAERIGMVSTGAKELGKETFFTYRFLHLAIYRHLVDGGKARVKVKVPDTPTYPLQTRPVVPRPVNIGDFCVLTRPVGRVKHVPAEEWFVFPSGFVQFCPVL